MKLDAAAVARLRAMLGGRPDRYDFATVMQRWGAEVLGDPLADISLTQAPGADHFEWPSDRPEDGADHLARQITRRPGRPWGQSIPGRPPGDVEHAAALALGIIFHEFTGKKPARFFSEHKPGEVSLFFKFADSAFRAIGLQPNGAAFRQVSVRWDKLPKRAMRQWILQGGLSSKRRKSKK